jgi:hypothetical protein
LSTNDTVHSPSSLRNEPHLLGGCVEVLAVVADSFVRRQWKDLLSRPILQSASVRCAIHHSPGWPKRLLGLRAAIKIVSHSLLFAYSLLANQHSWGMIREVRESYTHPTKRLVRYPRTDGQTTLCLWPSGRGANHEGQSWVQTGADQQSSRSCPLQELVPLPLSFGILTSRGLLSFARNLNCLCTHPLRLDSRWTLGSFLPVIGGIICSTVRFYRKGE